MPDRLQRMIHQIQFYREQLLVDFVTQLMTFEQQMSLRPDRTGVHLVLRLNQRHDNIVLSLEDLPDVRRPPPSLRKTARVNDKAGRIFLAVPNGNNFMTRDEEENVPSG